MEPPPPSGAAPPAGVAAPRRRREPTPVSCRADGCSELCQPEFPFQRRLRACREHASAPSVLVGGVAQRVCQQCVRFHPVENFAGNRRSCMQSLAERKLRAAAASTSGQNQAAGAAAKAARGGRRPSADAGQGGGDPQGAGALRQPPPSLFDSAGSDGRGAAPQSLYDSAGELAAAAAAGAPANAAQQRQEETLLRALQQYQYQQSPWAGGAGVAPGQGALAQAYAAGGAFSQPHLAGPPSYQGDAAEEQAGQQERLMELRELLRRDREKLAGNRLGRSPQHGHVAGPGGPYAGPPAAAAAVPQHRGLNETWSSHSPAAQPAPPPQQQTVGGQLASALQESNLLADVVHQYPGALGRIDQVVQEGAGTEEVMAELRPLVEVALLSQQMGRGTPAWM